jgi:hypothetical protein
MCFSLIQLAPGSRNLSQAEKSKIIYAKAKKIHKMTTIFTQNGNFIYPGQF